MSNPKVCAADYPVFMYCNLDTARLRWTGGAYVWH